MKKQMIALVLVLLVSVGCARVRMEAPKDPIKVDISMRLDIYQHVQSDIDKIEEIVSGAQGQDNSSRLLDTLSLFPGIAYAQDGLSSNATDAAFRRKDRRAELSRYEQQGIVGENRSGFVEIRRPGQATASIKAMVDAENSDRMAIYKSIAIANNAPIDGVKEMYAARLQNDAPGGTPIEARSKQTGRYEWKIK